MKILVHRQPLNFRADTTHSAQTIDLDLNSLINPKYQADYEADEQSAQIIVRDLELLVICNLRKKPTRSTPNFR
jgi:hypothetical protein